MEELREVGRSEAVEGLDGEEEYFVVDAGGHSDIHPRSLKVTSFILVFSFPLNLGILATLLHPISHGFLHCHEST